MTDAIELLCLDAGSSSLKYATYGADVAAQRLDPHASGTLPAGNDADASLAAVLADMAPDARDAVAVVGHRVVFGGPAYVRPVVVTDDVLAQLETFVELEPLHLRPELDLIASARRRFPQAVHVACFDTAFHRAAPEIARRLPLPEIDPILQRYGFHGLSYEYIASQLPEGAGRTIVAHLGSGASLCALRDGRPVDTTMGFSALGGLMMGTRPGDLDPGIILRLLETGYDVASLSRLLYDRSGLAGVSGVTADMRALLAEAERDPRCAAAVELFVYNAVKHIGAMAAVLGGLDTFVFTAGIGERAPAIRSSVAAAFGYLGLALDPEANDRNDRCISSEESRVRVLVIPTDENLMIARHALATLVSARAEKPRSA